MAMIYTGIAISIGLVLYALRYWRLFWYGMVEVVVSIGVIYFDFDPAIFPSGVGCKGSSLFGFGCWFQSHLVILAGIYIFVRGVDNMVKGWSHPRKSLNRDPERNPDWLSQSVPTILQTLAVIAALGSGWFWIKSAMITTPTEFRIFVNSASNPTSPFSTNPGDVGFSARSPALTELGNSLVEQSKFNSQAAWCAAASAVLAALSMFATWVRGFLRDREIYPDA